MSKENIKDGLLKINWVKNYMPILQKIEADFYREKPFINYRIGMTIHLEAKTAYLALILKSGGAEVAISGSNPLSTQNDVVETLVEMGVYVYGQWGVSQQEYVNNLNQVLDHKPHLIIDDGADLTVLLHTDRKNLLSNVYGCCEETTTGLTRIKALEKEKQLKFPVIAVNDASCKYLFDNRYGTGQSAWDGILRTTNLNVSGKKVVIAGFGWVGKGIALRGRGLGAKIYITEIDPVKALEAHMEGFEVLTMSEAAEIGDIFITATGNINVINKTHLEKMKDGAILCNSGHFDVEINLQDLNNLSVEKKTARKNIEQYSLKNGKKLFLLGKGRLVNLACADGHPIEIMDLSFGIQALSVLYLLKHKDSLKPNLYSVPEDINNEVANIFLKSKNIDIDTLSSEQKEYLSKY